LHEAGRIPRTVDCELTRDLGTVNALIPTMNSVTDVMAAIFNIHLATVGFVM